MKLPYQTFVYVDSSLALQQSHFLDLTQNKSTTHPIVSCSEQKYTSYLNNVRVLQEGLQDGCHSVGAPRVPPLPHPRSKAMAICILQQGHRSDPTLHAAGPLHATIHSLSRPLL